MKKLILILILILNLTACDFKQEKVISINIGSEPITLNPVANVTADGVTLISHCFEGLTKTSIKNKNLKGVNLGEITLGQAKSYEKNINPDGTVSYIFILRDDIFWSDNIPVKAQDFEYSMKYCVDPINNCISSYHLDIIQNASEIISGKISKDLLGVKALDDKKLEIILDLDYPFFLERCSWPQYMPIREDIIKTYGENWYLNPENYICNGAMKLESWSHDSNIILVPNENYYDRDKIKIKNLKFILSSDVNSMFAAYKNNQVDFIQKLPRQEENIKKSKSYFSHETLAVMFVSFQNQKAPFDNKLVRKAFSLAIDREHITKNILRNGELPAGGLIPWGCVDQNKIDFRKQAGNYYEINNYKNNCEQAKKLLAQAGYPDGKDFPVVEYLCSNIDVMKSVAEALQNMWQEVLGVTVQIKTQDWNAFLGLQQAGDFEVSHLTWLGGDDPLCYLEMNYSANNYAKYSNPEYQKIINQVQNEKNLDINKRNELLARAEKLVIQEDMGIAPLFFPVAAGLLRENITGVYRSKYNNYFFIYSDIN